MILIVEDDADTALMLETLLSEAHYQVEVARDGKTALTRVAQLQPQLVLTDVNLPEMDGISLCREIRRSSQVPILMLSARKEEFDRVLGLEMGADDYLGKPFSPRELLARVKALLRRQQPLQPPQVLEFGRLRIDLDERQASLEGQALPLTPSEYALLLCFAQRPRRALSRQQLADLALGQDWLGDERTIDVHVRHLRAKLKNAARHPYLFSVRGLGYKFVPE